jgi:hypothetical protein
LKLTVFFIVYFPLVWSFAAPASPALAAVHGPPGP